jgi:hypothetical protein
MWKQPCKVCLRERGADLCVRGRACHGFTAGEDRLFVFGGTGASGALSRMQLRGAAPPSLCRPSAKDLYCTQPPPRGGDQAVMPTPRGRRPMQQDDRHGHNFPVSMQERASTFPFHGQQHFRWQACLETSTPSIRPPSPGLPCPRP